VRRELDRLRRILVRREKSDEEREEIRVYEYV